MMTSAFQRTRHAPAPVWPRVMTAEPERHPARQRHPYRQRGQVRAESLALWGTQDSAIPRVTIAPPQASPFRHKRVMAGGVAAALVGTFVIAFPVTGTVAPDTPAAVIPFPSLTPAPAVLTIAPGLDYYSDTIADPAIRIAAQPSLHAPTRPAMPTPGAAADAFICADCTSPAPRLDGITISLQGGGAALGNITSALGSMGASAVLTRQGAIDVATAQIRFYRPQDIGTAQALARRFGATLVDVTWLSDAAPARIDLLLPHDTKIE